MIRRLLTITLLLLMVFAIGVSAAQEKSKRVAKNSAVKKKVKPQARKAPAAVEPAAVAPLIAAPSAEDKIADLKEDMNKAVASLKSQVDTVKSDNNDAKVGGVIFFQWSRYTQGGGTNPNAFDVTRAYLDVKKKLDWNASVRMTLDVSRISGAARQNLFDYLKYAYVDLPIDLPKPTQLIPWSLTGKAGLQHTVWIDWADKMLNLRFVAKSLLDNQSVMSSADFGLGAIGKFTIPSLPEIEYHATVLNGTGYATNESDAKKSVAARFNSAVYDGGDYGKVILGLYANVEAMNLNNFSYSGSNKQGGFGLGYQHDIGRLFYEYVTGSKSNKKINGSSLGGTLNLGGLTSWLDRIGLFARMDNYVPDTTGTNNDQKKTFYGLTYDWGKDVRFALDMQTAQTGSGATTSILYLQSSINF